MDPLFPLAIVIIILLVVIFVVSYVLNKRTPVPKGCEQINISEEFCLQCSNTDCSIKEKFNIKKIQEELDEEAKED